jgi:hypothetical protein
VHTGLWWGEQRERNHLENLNIDEKIILKWNFKIQDGEDWAGWLGIKTNGGLM